MSCVLSVCPTDDADYQGTVGAKFTIDAQSATHAPDLVALVSAAYDTQTQTGSPFTFTIVSGVNNLATIVTAGEVGEMVRIVEVCPGGTTFQLRRYAVHNPKHDGSFVRIKGV